MDKLIKKHFSLSDWEFETSHRYYITAVYYVSSPSSLAAPTVGGSGFWYYCYLKDALAHNVPDGRFIAYISQRNADMLFHLYFRQQTPLVHLGDQNGYYLLYDSAIPDIKLYRYVAGVATFIGSVPMPAWTYDTFLRIRIDFYQYITGALMTTLRVHVYQEVAGEWVSQGYLEDGDNEFADSAENRIGFALAGAYPLYPSLIDDIEIWKKT